MADALGVFLDAARPVAARLQRRKVRRQVGFQGQG
jgi:hypothetical protein